MSEEQSKSGQAPSPDETHYCTDPTCNAEVCNDLDHRTSGRTSSPETPWAPIVETMRRDRDYRGSITRTDALGRRREKRCGHQHSRRDLAMKCAEKWAAQMNAPAKMPSSAELDR